jgi:hypothetical protein
MKTMILSAVYILLFHIDLPAQYFYYNNRFTDRPLLIEAGMATGIMNSFTDIGGKKGEGRPFIKDLNWKNTAPCFGMYTAATYRYAMALRLEITRGMVQGADSQLKKVAASTAGRYERNFSFKSSIAEVQMAMEIHPLCFTVYEKIPFLSPYLIAGSGFFSFEPRARLNGRWYSLQPLRTEGQGFPEYPGNLPYRLRQFNFLVGTGLRYEAGSRLLLRLELVHRILSTDYLDDVSGDYPDPGLFNRYMPPRQAAIAAQLSDRQPELNNSNVAYPGSPRGNPANKDAYFTLQLKLGFAFRSPISANR